MPKKGEQSKRIDADLLPLMQEYLDEIENPGTARLRTTPLRRLAMYLRAAGVEDPRHITKEIVKGFPEFLWTMDLSQSTRESNMYIAKYWMEWLKQKGILVYNPWGDKDYPLFGNIRISIPKTQELSPRELGLVFEAHRQRRNRMAPFWWHREAVMLACIYAWGVGPTEMVTMTTGQVHPGLEYVTLKNFLSPVRDLKSVPYSEEMKTIIRRWLNVRRPREKPGVDNLIIDITGDAVTTKSVIRQMSELGKEAGVHLTSTKLRETGIQEFLRSSISIEEVAAMLGVSRETALLHIKDDENPYSKEAQQLINRMTARLRERYEANGNKYWRHPDAKEDERTAGVREATDIPNPGTGHDPRSLP